MFRKAVFSALLLALGATGSIKAQQAGQAKKNILFIVADDFGYSDSTVYGSTKYYETPNIQKLADSGLLFTNAHTASPLCSPTRCSLLSGQNPARVGVLQANCHTGEEFRPASLRPRASPSHPMLLVSSANRLPPQHFTYAQAFKEAGYATAHFGKWHCGFGPGFEPKDRGFDIDVPHTPKASGPGGGYLAPWQFVKDPAFKGKGKPGEHIDTWMAGQAADYIRQCKERGKPFLINFWAYSVHTPIDGRPDYIKHFAAKTDPTGRHNHEVMGAMIKSFDDAVGLLIKALKENGVYNDTMIVLTSDNGGLYGVTSNYPKRGYKAGTYKGGTAVPLIVVNPGVTKPGSKTAALVSSQDFYPTFLELCGLKPRPKQHLDGISFADVIQGKAKVSQRRDHLVHFCALGKFPFSMVMGYTSSIQRGDYKLIRFWFDGPGGDHKYELYNVANDESERKDISATHPEVVSELAKLMDTKFSAMKAIVPAKNPTYQPELSYIYDVPVHLFQPKAAEARKKGKNLVKITVKHTDQGLDFVTSPESTTFMLKPVKADVFGDVAAATFDRKTGPLALAVTFSTEKPIKGTLRVHAMKKPPKNPSRGKGIPFTIKAGKESRATIQIPAPKDNQQIRNFIVTLSNHGSPFTLVDYQVMNAGGKTLSQFSMKKR